MMKPGLSQSSFRISKHFCLAVISALILAVTASLVWAMAGSTVPRKGEGKAITPGREREVAESLLSRIFDSYRGYSRGSFSDIVDDDFTSGGQSFVSGVESSFYSARPLQLDYFLNTVNLTGDKLAVSFTWNKKDVPRDTGSQRKSQGECLFVFKKAGEDWKLYDVKGNSPF